MFGIDPMIVAFGLGVGILIGLTGIGGGSLMTPLLIIVVGVKPVVAIGTDLAYGAITKTLGGWRHFRKGTVDLQLSKWMAFGSLPGALLGVFLVDVLHAKHGTDFDTVLLACVAGALFIVSGATLVRALFLPALVARETDHAPLFGRRRTAAVVIGFVLGIILGLTSVGSGALIGFALILVFHLTPRRVVGTDVFHAAILLWVAGSAHFVAGNVDFGLMGQILLGSMPGVVIGAALIDKVPAHGLRVGLGCVMLGSALGVLTKAGVELPAPAIVGPPLAIGVLALFLHRSGIGRVPRTEAATA